MLTSRACLHTVKIKGDRGGLGGSREGGGTGLGKRRGGRWAWKEKGGNGGGNGGGLRLRQARGEVGQEFPTYKSCRETVPSVPMCKLPLNSSSALQSYLLPPPPIPQSRYHRLSFETPLRWYLPPKAHCCCALHALTQFCLLVVEGYQLWVVSVGVFCSQCELSGL